MPAVTSWGKLLWPSSVHANSFPSYTQFCWEKTGLKDTVSYLYSNIFSHLLAHNNIWVKNMLVQSLETCFVICVTRLCCLKILCVSTGRHQDVNGMCVTSLQPTDLSPETQEVLSGIQRAHIPPHTYSLCSLEEMSKDTGHFSLCFTSFSSPRSQQVVY